MDKANTRGPHVPRRACKYGHEFPDHQTKPGKKRRCPTCLAAKPVRMCSIGGCAKPVYARGWCSAHYSRFARHGDAEAEVRPYGVSATERCSVKECGKPYFAKGLCREHYNKRYSAATAAVECAVGWCDRPSSRRGWCPTHYQRFMKYGSPEAGPAYRRRRGTGYPPEWYKEQRRRKIGWPSKDTLAYVEIIRADPCVYCGAPCEHVDHIRAVGRGGAGDWRNLAPACASCNLSKLTRDVLEFMLERLDGAAG